MKFIKIGTKHKPIEKYEQIKFTKIPFDLDYEMMLDHIQRGVPQAQCPSFIRPKQEKTFKDPVIDPRENWGSFFKRVANFEDPPLVNYVIVQ